MRLRPTILRIVVFVVTFLSFARLINCHFTWWDDHLTIRENPRLNPPTADTLGFYWNIAQAGEHSTMGLYVPVTYTVWSGLALLAHRDAPDADGFFLNPWVFHCANVLIHACTAVIVFQLLLRLFGNDVAAGIGALLFALHPVQVESAGWISGTKDLLCGLFSISALLMYVRYLQLRFDSQKLPATIAANPSDRSGSVLEYQSQAVDDPHKRWPRRWRYLLGMLFFALGMLSKPTAVVVPLMAAVTGTLLAGASRDPGGNHPRLCRATLVSLIPWFVLMIPCLIWTKIVQPATWNSPLPLWARPAVAADALAFYLCKLVWPLHLCVDYGHNPQAILDNHLIFFNWIAPAGVAALLWYKRKKWRVPIAATALFVIPLLPVLGFVGFEFQQLSTTSDHYLYLPVLGVAVLVCWLLTRIQSPNTIPIAIIILIMLCVRTIFQEPVWQDTRSLFLHNLAINPQSITSSDSLGYVAGNDARILAKSGHPTEARRLFEESINWYQHSLTIDPMSVPSMYNLAQDYQAIGEHENGLEQMHRIVQVQPLLPPGLRVDPIEMAHRLYDFPDIPGAIAWLEDVLRRDPGNAQAAVLHERAIEHLQHGSK